MQGRGREELLARLHKAQAELEDIEELNQAILGGSGVHVGVRLAQRVRHLNEERRRELQKQIEQLKKVLEERGVKL